MACQIRLASDGASATGTAVAVCAVIWSQRPASTTTISRATTSGNPHMSARGGAARSSRPQLGQSVRLLEACVEQWRQRTVRCRSWSGSPQTGQTLVPT